MVLSELVSNINALNYLAPTFLFYFFGIACCVHKLCYMLWAVYIIQCRPILCGLSFQMPLLSNFRTTRGMHKLCLHEFVLYWVSHKFFFHESRRLPLKRWVKPTPPRNNMYCYALHKITRCLHLRNLG